MATGNWIIDNLTNALSTWTNALHEIWALLTTSLQDFRGGAIWRIILNVHGGLKAIAYALLVLFFIMGVVKTTTSFAEIKRPEQAFKLFIRFVIAKAVVSYSMDLMLLIYKVIQGVMSEIYGHTGNILTGEIVLPDILKEKILACTFLESIPLWIVALIGSLLVTVLSFVMILTVYSRFFRLYMYTAIAPIPLSSFAGEGTSQVGRQFLKSYAGACAQGAIIIIACIIYSVFASSPPEVGDTSLSAVQMVWNYMAELIFNLLILVGAVKMSERVVKEMIGF